MNKARAKSKVYYDKKQRAANFKTGDYVYLLIGGHKGKSDNQYTDPYEIIASLGKNNIKIRTNTGTRIVHVNSLKLNKSKR